MKTQARQDFAKMITIEEYENLRSKIEKVGKCDFIPSKNEVEEIIKEDLLKYLPFLIWIDMQGLQPLDKEEREVLLMIDNIVLDFEEKLYDYWEREGEE